MTGACPRAGPAHSPDPVPLLEVALALGVQLLVARPPDLLLPPDVPRIRAPPEWRAAQALVGIINAAFAVLADYTAARDAHAPCALRTADDDIPF